MQKNKINVWQKLFASDFKYSYASWIMNHQYKPPTELPLLTAYTVNVKVWISLKYLEDLSKMFQLIENDSIISMNIIK